MQTEIEPVQLITAIRESFIGAEQVYMNGSCVLFFRILKTVYPAALPYWSATHKHMITHLDGKFYDITGEVEHESSYKLDDDEYSSVPVCVAFPQEKEERKRYHKLFKMSDYAAK